MNDAPELQPLALREDAQTGDRFVLYTKPDGIGLELRFEGEEPWATPKQMADLFARDITVIRRHLKAIFADGELDENSVRAESALTAADGKTYNTQIYNLDVILAVGYRVGSRQGIMFRRWANQILRQYLIKGFVIDAPRLKDPKRNDHLDELLEEIEDIRASEANVWQRALELVSKCSDYYAITEEDKGNYFATFQNTVHWAVTSCTAAEIVHQRSDAAKPYAGLSTFDGINEGQQPNSGHMKIAKNYYGRDEIERLRTITNLALDFLASQAQQGRLATVAQYTTKLRELVKFDGRPLIREGHKGSISKPAATRKRCRSLQFISSARGLRRKHPAKSRWTS